MLWLHRRDTEQERVKETNLHREVPLQVWKHLSQKHGKGAVSHWNCLTVSQWNQSPFISRLSCYSENFIPLPADFKGLWV